ncbi:MAG TPA: outer membrane lipoprotein-sorting protein [bacterium]|nr:outer membrane lipoprotein-sorting protein [bacterium]
MIRTTTGVFLAVLLLLSQISPAYGLSPEDLPEDPSERATVIMNHIDDMWRGDSSKATMTMHVKTERWERTLTMTAWSLGKDYSLVKILSPEKEAGTATLKYENDIYNYLPKTDRTIKITSGMMMGSWMGSHFTNDDLVKESRLADDYNLKVVFEGERDGASIWEIELTPKPDAAVVWGKILFTVRQSDLMPVESRYYDEDGDLVRTMTFSDYTTMDGRRVPARMKLIPEDDPGEFTEMIYEKLEFNVNIDSSFFSIRNLKQR